MARVRGKIDPAAVEVEAPPLDANVGLYRDRAGDPRGKEVTEGKANFAAVTAAALETVAALDTESVASPAPEDE